MLTLYLNFHYLSHLTLLCQYYGEFLIRDSSQCFDLLDWDLIHKYLYLWQVSVLLLFCLVSLLVYLYLLFLGVFWHVLRILDCLVERFVLRERVKVILICYLLYFHLFLLVWIYRQYLDCFILVVCDMILLLLLVIVLVVAYFLLMLIQPFLYRPYLL